MPSNTLRGEGEDEWTKHKKFNFRRLLNIEPVNSDAKYEFHDFELRNAIYVSSNEYAILCQEFDELYNRDCLPKYGNLEQVLHLLSLYPKNAFEIFERITPELNGNKQLVLEAVKLEEVIFCYIPLKLQRDPEVQKAHIEAFPESTRVSDFLKDDKDAEE